MICYQNNVGCRNSIRCCGTSRPPTPPPTPALETAYGGIYNAMSGYIAMDGPNVPTPVTIMNADMPLNNVAVAASALVIQVAGTYRVSYSASYSDIVSAYTQFFVASNGAPLPGSYTQRDTITNQVENVATQLLVTLPAGAALQLMAQSDDGDSRFYFDHGSVKLAAELIAK